MFNDLSSPLSLLTTRRSGKPRDPIAPGPDHAQLVEMIRIAGRTPDHGKLAPWRFVIVGDDRRDIDLNDLAPALTMVIADRGKAAGIPQ